MDETLTPTGNLIFWIGRVALAVHYTWTTVVAFSGGSIPLVGYRLGGGLVTGLLWMVVVGPLVYGVGTLLLRLAIGLVDLLPRIHLVAPRPTAASAGEDAAAGHPPETSDVVAEGRQPFPFNADSASYDRVNAAACAFAAQLAYNDPATVGRLTSAFLPQTEFTSVPIGRNVYVVVKDPTFVLVAFRGTDELADWGTNLRWKPVEALGGRVHSGFLGALDSLWGDLERDLGPPDDRPVWVCGHSLGGALATLAAGRLCEGGNVSTWRVGGLYTYGQPAVGDREFNRQLGDALDGKYFRFANTADVVVEETFSDFAHAGSLRFIDRGGSIHDQPTRRIRLDPLLARLFNDRERTPAQFADHSMQNYLQAVVEHRSPEDQILDRGLLWMTRVVMALGLAVSVILVVFLPLLAAIFFGLGGVFFLAHIVASVLVPQAYVDHAERWRR